MIQEFLYLKGRSYCTVFPFIFTIFLISFFWAVIVGILGEVKYFPIQVYIEFGEKKKSSKYFPKHCGEFHQVLIFYVTFFFLAEVLICSVLKGFCTIFAEYCPDPSFKSLHKGISWHSVQNHYWLTSLKFSSAHTNDYH